MLNQNVYMYIKGGESTPIGFDGEPIKKSKRGRPKGSTNKNKRAKVEI